MATTSGLFLTDMADVLRGAGLTVVEIAGWKSRGARVEGSTPDGGLRAITGGLVHHTAGPTQKAASRRGSAVERDYPSLQVVLGGRVDVPGPLAQLGLGFSGTWYVLAAGRANHSGAVDQVAYSNPRAIGVEAENPGDGSAWPAAQYAAYVTGCAALGTRYGITWRGHKEAAIPAGRKIDPTFDMGAFRIAVAAAQAGQKPTSPTTPTVPSTPTAATPAPVSPATLLERIGLMHVFVLFFYQGRRHAANLLTREWFEVPSEDVLGQWTTQLTRNGIPWAWHDKVGNSSRNVDRPEVFGQKVAW